MAEDGERNDLITNNTYLGSEEDRFEDAQYSLNSTGNVNNRDNQTEKGTSSKVDDDKETQDVEFVEVENDVVMKWAAIKNAEEYIINCEKYGKAGDEVCVMKSHVNNHTLKKENYNLMNGETIIVSIAAILKSGRTNDICKNTHYIIGGDVVPSEVELSFNEEISYKSLVLNWKPAKKTPAKYEITIHKIDAETTDKVDRSFLIASEKSTALIDSLDHLTDYYCVIVANYADGSDGKPVWSKTVKTKDLPPELYKVQLVKAHVDSLNPARQIVVTWTKPERNITISHYEVHLVDSDGNKRQIKRTDLKKENKARFQYLKSNTAYMACVVTFKKSLFAITKSTEVFSDTITTNPAAHQENFDIGVCGKPILEDCSSKWEKKYFSGNLKWKLPDLGTEKTNYKLLWVKATYLDEDEKKEIPLEVVGNTQIKPVQLKAGKSYVFTVTSSYLEIDNDRTVDVPISENLKTKMEKLAVPSVNWEGNTLTISWTHREGAIKYTVKIIGEDNELALSKVLNKDFLSIPMAESYRYGKNCQFLVEAEDRNGQSENAVKTVVIGGDEVVTDVIMEKRGRRELFIQWKSPKSTPQEYELHIYETKGESHISEMPVKIPAMEQRETSHKFVELKCKTQYRCTVYPIYNHCRGHGTYSNNVNTPPREKETAMEKDKTFGKPENISAKILKSVNEKSTVEVSWIPVRPGENFKVMNYHAVVKHDSWRKWSLFTAPLKSENFQPECTKMILNNVSPGCKYKIEITTTLKDLDSRQDKKIKAEESFKTDPAKAKMKNHYLLKDGTVTFYWCATQGTKMHKLVLRDEMQKNVLGEKEVEVTSENENDCKATLEINEKLRPGETCMAKVFTHALSGEIAETDWKTFFLGDEMNPKNVKAVRNTENPWRSVHVTFGLPDKESADEFEVVARPSEGKPKSCFVKTGDMVFPYLRSGVSYKFEVSARYGNSRSAQPSMSNSITTQDKNVGTPVMEYQNNKTVSVDLRGANFMAQSSRNAMSKDKDFGKVGNEKHSLICEGDKDLLQITWYPPSFGNFAADYKVEEYVINLQKEQHPPKIHRVVFDCSLTEYSYEIELDLGHKYTLSISTTYEDIDGDTMCHSNDHTFFVSSRPCKPEIIKNSIQENHLELKWNCVQGAVGYEVMIYTDGSTNPSIKESTKESTFYSKEFDTNLGYGKSYIAKVIVYGADNLKNFDSTEEELIGGDYVPTRVVATIHDEKVPDPSTQAAVQWKEPKYSPKSYDIEAYSENKMFKEMHVKADEKVESCLFEGLKAGTSYYFKVMAIHLEYGPNKLIGGCPSNKITTSPKPTQVKNVWHRVGPNPSTSIEIHWGKVDAEKMDETTKYRVRLESEDHTTKRKIYVMEDNVMVHGLESGVSYTVTVAAGNSDGFGKDSELYGLETALGTPKHVQLSIDEDHPTTTVHLKFDSAEGKPLHYMCKLFGYRNHREHQIGSPVSIRNCSHTFNKLDPNRDYKVDVHAVFASGDGAIVSSNKVKTGPSIVNIIDYGIYGENEKGYRQIFAKWSADTGCSFHEVQIVREPVDVVENTISIEKQHDMIYSCHYEAIEYSIQIRARNSTNLFGKWSGKKFIRLAPGRLQQISANLEQNGNITVQCAAARTYSPFYFMRAICDGNLESDEHFEADLKDLEVVKWFYSPKQCAQYYEFELWAEDSSGLNGEISKTNKIISKPGAGEIKEVELLQNTHIKISWKSLDRCASYQVNIQLKGGNSESIGNYGGTSCIYRCQSPGSTYFVSVRGVCKTVHGDWSDDYKITLVPSQVELVEQNIANEPVSIIHLKWHALDVEPVGYVVRPYCDGQEENVHKLGPRETEITFEKDALHPGGWYHYKIEAYNEAGAGSSVMTEKYKVAWEKLKLLEVIPHDSDPSHKATIQWDKPAGVNSFKLDIENNQTGAISSIRLTDKRFLFESGLPGNVYMVRVYCGYDDRFSSEYKEERMIMQPDSPRNIKVVADEESSGLVVEFTACSSPRPTYEIHVKCLSKQLDIMIFPTQENRYLVPDLIPGASYQISVATVVEGIKSRFSCCKHKIQTVPASIVNLTSSFKNGSAVFEWDAPKFKPNKYIVEWRIDDGVITEEHTYVPRFALEYIQPAHRYRFRVMASNSSGNGQMSDWKTFISKPLPPHDVTVFANPELPNTSLVVEFQDEKHHLKEYRVTLKSLDDQDQPDITVRTSELIAVVEDLRPGTSYIAYVQTLFCEEESDRAMSPYF